MSKWSTNLDQKKVAVAGINSRYLGLASNAVRMAQFQLARSKLAKIEFITHKKRIKAVEKPLIPRLSSSYCALKPSK